ncbi:MAG: chloride channel protein, partial [Victivallales bacterium]|nr:chloride channel protein [Victivallales bacterium]
AFLGYAFSLFLHSIGITDVSPISCVAAGMAGVLAGVMHAPLTGLFLIAELLHSYTMMLPLMFVVAISAGFSKFFARKNLYMTTLKSTEDDDVDTLEELEKIPVSEYAETGYCTVLTTDSFQSLLNVMMNTRQGIFPVLDRKGLLMGIVDEGDIRPLIAESGSHWKSPVEELMSPPPCVIQQSTPIGKVAELFETRSENLLPLVDEHGKFTAMISRSHLLDNYRHYIYSKMWVDNQ